MRIKIFFFIQLSLTSVVSNLVVIFNSKSKLKWLQQKKICFFHQVCVQKTTLDYQGSHTIKNVSGPKSPQRILQERYSHHGKWKRNCGKFRTGYKNHMNLLTTSAFCSPISPFQIKFDSITGIGVYAKKALTVKEHSNPVQSLLKGTYSTFQLKTNATWSLVSLSIFSWIRRSISLSIISCCSLWCLHEQKVW